MPTIAVLGAGPGLGLAVARRYGTQGYKVALVARREAALTGYVEQLAAQGIHAAAVVGDLTDRDEFGALAERVRQAAGHPDVVYVAPTATNLDFTPAIDLTVDAAAATMRLIYEATVASVQEFLPHMLEQRSGAILTAQGATALFAPPGMSGPGPAMAAQRHYLQSLGREVSEHGVTVGRLYISGLIRHSAIDQAMQAAGTKIPSIGLLHPDDLANKLWKMHQKGGNHEAVAPTWGRMIMPLASTTPVRAMIRRSRTRHQPSPSR